MACSNEMFTTVPLYVTKIGSGGGRVARKIAHARFSNPGAVVATRVEKGWMPTTSAILSSIIIYSFTLLGTGRGSCLRETLREST